VEYAKMTKCAEVIKKDRIEVNGSICLEPAAGAAVEPQFVSPTTAAQVKILETHSDHAIVEVICACGCKNRIACYF